jgi:Ran GTPase-activating protein (RanGAP) involved in mRNA processing and transport
LLNRKSINDDEGEDLVKSLQYNHTLRVLNLESNHLGPSFLYALADTLKVNTSLTNIDISGNSLTNGNNISGIEALCEALRENDTLTHLSLYNTSLPEKAGQLLLDTLDDNDSLILLDLEKNP